MRKISFITAVISALALACTGCIDLWQPEPFDGFDDGLAHLSVGTGGGK